MPTKSIEVIKRKDDENDQLDCRIYSSPAAAGLLCMAGATIAVEIAQYSRITRQIPYILVQKRSKSLDWIKMEADYILAHR